MYRIFSNSVPTSQKTCNPHFKNQSTKNIYENNRYLGLQEHRIPSLLLSSRTDAVLFGKLVRILKMKAVDSSSGYEVAQLVEALRYRSEGRRLDSRWCHWNFSLT